MAKKIISASVAMDAYDKSSKDAFSKWFEGAVDEINAAIKKHMDKSRSFCVSVHIPDLQHAANWCQWTKSEIESAYWTCRCTCDKDIHHESVMLIELSW